MNILIEQLGLLNYGLIAKKERCIKQVYDYFNLWDGRIFTPSFKKINGVIEKSIDKKNIGYTIYIIIPRRSGKVLHYYRDLDEIKEIQSKNIMKTSGYRYIHKNLMIFNEIDYYPEEYEDSRFLYVSTSSFILLDSIYRQEELNF
ncbi:MAG: hypothetical protein WDM90_00880 [Ferruginibacter sp.]